MNARSSWASGLVLIAEAAEAAVEADLDRAEGEHRGRALPREPFSCEMPAAFWSWCWSGVGEKIARWR